MLVKQFFIILTVFFVDNFTKIGEVDEAVFDNVVREVYDFLLEGVQTEHLHRCMEILRRDTVVQFPFVCNAIKSKCCINSCITAFITKCGSRATHL